MKVLFISIIIKIIIYLFIFNLNKVYPINLIYNHLPISSLKLNEILVNQIKIIKNVVIKINYIKKNDTEIHTIYAFFIFDQIIVDTTLLPPLIIIDKLWFTTYDNKKYE